MFTTRTVRSVALIMFLGALLFEAGCAGTSGNPGGGGQTTAPAAPTGLAATPGNAQVLLTWAATANATGYTVKRSTTTGGPYTAIASQPTTSFTDTPLTNGTKYSYVVSASNSASASPNSAEVSATPTLAPPAVPTGLAATAGNAQVTLTWNAATGATSYHLKRSTTSGAETQIAAPASNSFTDTAVTNGTKYFYEVSAVNSTGESANSNEINATPTAPAAAPSAPTGLQGAAGNAQVVLTWTASTGATSYHVKRSTTSGTETQISAPTSTSFTDTTVTNGTKYFYVVSAVNANGESANSNEVSATPTAPATAPATPTGLQATGGNAQISLTWNASTGPTSYTHNSS